MLDQGWKPINTAPFETLSDGQELDWTLLWVPDERGDDLADEWLWRDDERACGTFKTAPTHWRPLPAGPVDEAGAADA